ncbi:MAG: thiamine phosphate synthase [Sphingomonas sp.]
MPRRHTVHRPFLPQCWLMTDERMGDDLWPALERLPRGAGVIFRHYSLPKAARRAMFERVAAIARRRGLVLVRAGDERLGRGEAGIHGRINKRAAGLRSWPAHNRREVMAGVRAGADIILISPVFATRSHPGARPLGRVRALITVAGVKVPIIALGGIDQSHQRWLLSAGFYGWAGIDAWR